ncbi:unnamed protein product, partial [Closterium sp. NIES-54]
MPSHRRGPSSCRLPSRRCDPTYRRCLRSPRCGLTLRCLPSRCCGRRRHHRLLLRQCHAFTPPWTLTLLPPTLMSPLPASLPPPAFPMLRPLQPPPAFMLPQPHLSLLVLKPPWSPSLLAPCLHASTTPTAVACLYTAAAPTAAACLRVVMTPTAASAFPHATTALAPSPLATTAVTAKPTQQRQPPPPADQPQQSPRGACPATAAPLLPPFPSKRTVATATIWSPPNKSSYHHVALSSSCQKEPCSLPRLGKAYLYKIWPGLQEAMQPLLRGHGMGSAGMLSAVRGGAGMVSAVRGGSGMVSAVRGGAGMCCAVRGGAGMGSAWKGGAGMGSAVKEGSCMVSAVRGGAGMVSAVRGGDGMVSAWREAIEDGARLMVESYFFLVTPADVPPYANWFVCEWAEHHCEAHHAFEDALLGHHLNPTKFH